jgi:hypothetical protein
MTICIAVRTEDEGVVCMTDTAISLGNNRFNTPGIKGEWFGADFVMWAGDVWCAQKILRSDPAELTFQETCDKFGKKYRETDTRHPDVPVDFLRVSPEHEIEVIEANGSCIGGFDYACIGHGSFTAWPLMDALYRRLRTPTVYNVKRMLNEVGRLTEKYDTTVYRPLVFELVP